ncbi:MAG TPA: CrcB family protein [Ktedonobacterales bacterium]
MSLATLLLIGAAGALGTLARYGLGIWLARRHLVHPAVVTFVINVSGAFAIGLVFTAGGFHIGPLAPTIRLVLGAGFLGGYTTFSTLSVETVSLARRGQTLHAWVNALGTLLAGALAAAAGMMAGRAL